MSNTSQLQITTQLTEDHWTITATVLPNSFLPADIFMYQNTGTTELGTYQGICGQSELLRLQVWAGEALPIFGNKYVRWNQAKIIVDSDVNPQVVVNNLTFTAKQLSLALQAAASSTQVVTITT
jgi:hypothetical protein